MNDLPKRLTPEMSSRKLQALDLIKHYYLKHGHSPTLGEIAAGLGVSRQRAHALVNALERDDLVRRVRGKSRGIMLMNAAAQVSENDALLKLQAAGWGIAIGDRLLNIPLTDLGLPLAPQLDHIPEDGIGDGRDDRQRRRG